MQLGLAHRGDPLHYYRCDPVEWVTVQGLLTYQERERRRATWRANEAELRSIGVRMKKGAA